MRAIRIMSRLKHLRTFLVCLQGCLGSLFWSCIMLFAIFYLFSLLILQIIAGYLADTKQTLEGELEEMFGSLGVAILTLYRSATGGDDWSMAYNAVSETGEIGAIIFLLFISFTQLALINIITGIFV